MPRVSHAAGGNGISQNAKKQTKEMQKYSQLNILNVILAAGRWKIFNTPVSGLIPFKCRYSDSKWSLNDVKDQFEIVTMRPAPITETVNIVEPHTFRK